MESNNLIYGSVGVLVLSGTYFGGIAGSGILVGFLTATGIGILIFKLKSSFPWLYKKIIKHNVMSDLCLSGLLVFLLASNTAISIIASASAALLVSAGLGVAKNYGDLVKEI